MKNIFVFIFLSLFWGIGLSQPAWTPVNYTNSTTAYCVISIDGQPAVTGDKVGAFVQGECRSVGEVTVYSGAAYVTLVIQGETIEAVNFRVWVADQDLICEVPSTVQSNPGNTIGYPPDYVVIDAFSSVCADPFGPVVTYTNSTTAYGVVTVDGLPATESDIVGVYVGAECRAKGNPVIADGVAYVTLVVQTEVVEQLEFRVLDGGMCKTDINVLTVASVPGGNIGYPPNYLQLAAEIPAVGIVAKQMTNSISLHPNPTAGQVYIRTSEELPGDFVIKLIDVKGQILKSSQLIGLWINENYRFDISAVNPGLYIIQLEGAHINKRMKVVKE